MTKPGVYDPWRQQAAAPKAPKVRDPDEPRPEEVCVNFVGLRTGINIWLDADEHEHPDIEAQRILTECVRSMMSQTVMRYLFESWGIYLTPQKGDVLVGGLHIVVPEDRAKERATDALALALRAAQNAENSPAEQLLEKARIKPFVI